MQQTQLWVITVWIYLWFVFQLGAPQRLPKRLRFVVDVSGSMYRFNGLDGRLERMMEAACLVMEALDGYDNKIKVLKHSVFVLVLLLVLKE